MDHSPKEYTLHRYDLSEDRSLKPWNAGDEYLLQWFLERKDSNPNLAVYNDRFGYLSCYLNASDPVVISTQYSQEIAITKNCESNHLKVPTFCDPLSTPKIPIDIALIQVPKSLDLFQMYLTHLVQNSTDEVVVACAFMTRHFSPAILKIANTFFEEVEQSRAVKKSRLLLLKKKKAEFPPVHITSIEYKERTYKQYPGVFSASHIDYATQFFLNHLDLSSTPKTILDLGSGNGILSNEIHVQLPEAEVHSVDDSFLAIESGKLNMKGDMFHHHHTNNLSSFENDSFDMVVTNPPFHFEHEINIQVPITLFKDCYRILKPGGVLQLVANTHLNYRTHLKKIFPNTEVVAEDQKFIVYLCRK